MKNKKIDITSTVMISVFVLLIVAAALFVAVKWLSVDTQTPADALQDAHASSVPEEEILSEEPEKVKYVSYTDLSDKFLELCKNGDIDGLYDLYYDDYLTKMRENMADAPSKEVFDRNIKAEMLRVTGFDEYEYGTPELPPTGTPMSYASFIYYQANNEKSLPVPDGSITDCVNLVVYIDGGYQTNHFMVQIDGYWYFLV